MTQPRAHYSDGYSETIFKRTYARWSDKDQRRETHQESVDRYLNFFDNYVGDKHDYHLEPNVFDELRAGLVNLDIMPSMRSFSVAGPALEQVAMANYNCTAHGIDSIKAFSELQYILMTGAGSGFSVEIKFTNQLPVVPSVLSPSVKHIQVQDSRVGWCNALDDLLRHLYAGSTPTWDTKLCRPPGARLKTFGGYASGGQVLEDLFTHIVGIFKGAAGRRLTPFEVFSICTYIAQIVVVGGVRRSATIALFDKDDDQMMHAKAGEWWVENPHFAMANISAVFEEEPTKEDFDRFWAVLEHSGSGEPGIFNRRGVWKHLKAHGRKIHYPDGRLIPFLANPCCEILLRPRQACNLSGFAIRPDDDLQTLEYKAGLASILGTMQATINHFEYISPEWHENINEERLLGVCPSGFYDHPVLSRADDKSAYWLQQIRKKAIDANRFYAEKIGIPQSASVTSVKPAGNSGEMYNTASGIHPRRSKYFIRRIRVAKTDPVGPFLRDQGIPVEDSFQNPDRDLVFSFPRKAPDGAITVDDVSAIQALNHWKHVKENYTTHTVSATISVRDDEWDIAGDWVYANFKHITGLAFLPHDGGSYLQAPYETISEFEYEKLLKEMPVKIDWDLLKFYEQTDQTTASQELACVGDKCILP